MQPFFSIPARVCDATGAGETRTEAPAGTSPPRPGMKGEVSNSLATSTGHRNQSRDCQTPVGNNGSKPCQSQVRLDKHGRSEVPQLLGQWSSQAKHLSCGGNITQEGIFSRLPLMLIYGTENTNNSKTDRQQIHKSTRQG